MSFSHRTEERDGRIVDLLADEQAGLRIAVSRLGAEMISLARRDQQGEWIGFLYRDNDLFTPAKGWANHATVMGYFLHRLKNERSIYRGREITGGTHGFLRHKNWRFNDDEIANGRLVYRITRDDFTDEEYPLDVSLTLTYTVEAEAVRVIFNFQNHESQLSAHVGFGLHPGFAAASFDSFQCEMPAGVYRRHFSPTNLLSGETEEIRIAGGRMPFAREKLPGSYILELVDVPDRTFVFRDQSSGRSVTLDLTEVPYLTIWSDGGPFLCLEPCWGLTDHEEQRAFEEKEGIQVIPPNEQLQASFTMSPGLTN